MKTYKFKMYSNHGNVELHKTIEGHASVWNHCIALQRRYYGIYGQYIPKFRLINHISKLKRLPRFAHWNQLPSQSIQDVVGRIDKGYKAMFEARAQGKAWGRPRFKRRGKYKSFTLLQAGWELLPGNRIRIGKRIYQYFKSRDVFGNPKRCTIKRDPISDIYICILTQVASYMRRSKSQTPIPVGRASCPTHSPRGATCMWYHHATSNLGYLNRL